MELISLLSPYSVWSLGWGVEGSNPVSGGKVLLSPIGVRMVDWVSSPSDEMKSPEVLCAILCSCSEVNNSEVLCVVMCTLVHFCTWMTWRTQRSCVLSRAHLSTFVLGWHEELRGPVYYHVHIGSLLYLDNMKNSEVLCVVMCTLVHFCTWMTWRTQRSCVLSCAHWSTFVLGWHEELRGPVYYHVHIDPLLYLDDMKNSEVLCTIMCTFVHFCTWMTWRTQRSCVLSRAHWSTYVLGWHEELRGPVYYHVHIGPLLYLGVMKNSEVLCTIMCTLVHFCTLVSWRTQRSCVLSCAHWFTFVLGCHEELRDSEVLLCFCMHIGQLSYLDVTKNSEVLCAVMCTLVHFYTWMTWRTQRSCCAIVSALVHCWMIWRTETPYVRSCAHVPLLYSSQ